MRHPFDGITPAKPSRRSWLGAALAAASGLFALASRSQAVAPPRSAFDETDPEPRPKPTVGLNEQGKGPTTKALREEAAMTRALNENGGIIAPPRVTTLALGEEGAKK